MKTLSAAMNQSAGPSASSFLTQLHPGVMAAVFAFPASQRSATGECSRRQTKIK
jgi:hypothetical protein